MLKRSGVAASALGLGGVAVGRRAGQDDTPTSMEALMYLDQVHPLARFRVVSPSLDWTPEFETLPDGVETPVSENYDTRIVEYLNTNERVLFFPHVDAGIDRTTTYALTNVRGFGTDDPDEELGRVVEVRFSPADEVDWPNEGNATATTEGNGTTTTEGG